VRRSGRARLPADERVICVREDASVHHAPYMLEEDVHIDRTRRPRVPKTVAVRPARTADDNQRQTPSCRVRPQPVGFARDRSGRRWIDDDQVWVASACLVRGVRNITCAGDTKAFRMERVSEEFVANRLAFDKQEHRPRGGRLQRVHAGSSVGWFQ